MTHWVHNLPLKRMGYQLYLVFSLSGTGGTCKGFSFFLSLLITGAICHWFFL